MAANKNNDLKARIEARNKLNTDTEYEKSLDEKMKKKAKPVKKTFSFRGYEEDWALFTEINKARRINNSIALNMLISEYNQKNKDLIER